MPRSNWKGDLKLSLVSCPIALFSAASDSERIAFHMLNKETGNRLKQQYVDAETGDVVERDDRVKGYEIAKNDFVIVSEEELSHIEIESSRTIDIQSFSARTDVDPVYFDNRYFISRRTTRSARKPSPSFAKPCGRAIWSASPASFFMDASAASCWSLDRKASSRRRCTTPM